MTRRHLLLASLCALTCRPIFARDYPNKPVRLLVPFASGGNTDLIARVVADALTKTLGQTVVVENKPGAAGMIAATEIARAAPDGYSLLVASASAMAATPAVNPNISYDPVNDFSPIITITTMPAVMAVHPSFPAKDYAEFVAQVKNAPGKYAFATGGNGSAPHLQMELFKRLNTLNMVHIPYRGAGQAVNDTMTGQVPIVMDYAPTTIPLIKDGRLVPIIVGAPQRLEALPHVPTFKEVGLDPVNLMAFTGLVAPKDTPRSVVETLNAHVKKALEDPGVRKRLEGTGALIASNTPEQFAAQIKTEYASYKQVVASASISLNE